MTALPIDPTDDDLHEWLKAQACLHPRLGSVDQTLSLFRAAHQAGVEAERARAAAETTEEDPWCREERCEYRHWTSGGMPTHKRGSRCPEVQS